MDIAGRNDEMEELLDLLIEGEYGLSAVVIIDTFELKTAFAAETYNNIYVKNYFDCRVWVSMYRKNDEQMMDEIIKSVMPPSRLSEIMNLDYELKKSILSDCLRNKKFFIVLDEVSLDSTMSSLGKLIPNHENGSRILITLTDPQCLHSFELEDGSSVYRERPTRVTSGGLLYVILYHGSESLKNNMKLNIPSLKSLPTSLGNLDALAMPSSYIDHTPYDIWKMNKLRQLNFGYVIFNAPEHAKKNCSSLDNLNFISPLHPESCTPNLLGKLPKLRSIRIDGHMNSYHSVISSSLCKLSCLESLKLGKKSSQLPSVIIGNEYKYLGTPTLLSLSNTALKQDPMPRLEEFPHLQVLKLKQNSYLRRKLACYSSDFPRLKILHPKSMPWLEHRTMEKRTMPKLERLITNPCACLGRLPKELRYKKSFKNLELWWLRSELKQKLRDFEDKPQYAIQIYPYSV